MESAIGRSKYDPSFEKSAGARLIVIFLAGKRSPAFDMALRTRSRASHTVLLAMPTILNEGRPRLESPSTSIIRPSKP